MASNESILSSKKILSSLLRRRSGDGEDEIVDALHSRDKTRGLTEVIEDGDERLIRVLKRGFGLDEYERTEARPHDKDDDDDASGGGIGFGAGLGLGRLAAGLGGALVTAFTAIAPVLGVALAGAVGAALGSVIRRLLPDEVSDQIGGATARVVAAAGSEEAQAMVDTENRGIRQQYAAAVRRAVAEGKSPHTVPVPWQIAGEIDRGQPIGDKYKYLADSAYGNTIGRLWGDNKALQDAHARKDEWIRQYVDRIDPSGNAAPPSAAAPAAAAPATPNRAVTLSASQRPLEAVSQSIDRQIGNYPGLSADAMKAMSMIETRGGRVDDRPGSEFQGVFQLGEAVRQKYGVRDPHNIDENVRGALAYAYDNARALARRLNMDVSEITGDMLYMAHQQGVAGAAEIYRAAAADKSIAQLSSVRQRNIRSNIPGKQRGKIQTAQQFVDYYHDKIAQYGGVPVQARPQAAPEPLREPVDPMSTAVASLGAGEGGSGYGAMAAGSGDVLGLSNMVDIPQDSTLHEFLRGGY